ncbi:MULTISPECIES: dihydrolipoyl dehydrogenase [Flectobacillus]|jgi:dihydrolipoamide dehydrogenase|uniref:Dihydrolipoyl dehydrogenase n=1 Tax=Flectobacillus roseus TaxID=502259 RepID=A0ABT6YA68_9BACT|nr:MULTISPECIES: dihydrolipoyl dehydrogenase [Flectobacillus]MDI9860478.1 dihydrolipoyl dehydrogenase [Flectobacillus roseus]MDI9869937.1 dihydrolipoyl dehydrogenase [Flectobacillus roseus]NBA74745.1 dihydrolipoyl dehydrogenase [Emticicia sp. ODNR4P]PAC28203.1 dihydrolipoyl dehydrogenase [Flectobacillus sp. BAB-3569]
MATTYDLIVIGSGPGGYVAAIRASQLGLKCAVVERESLGGICLNWGCIPTKALLKSAQVFEYIKHASDYGITVSEASADFGAVIKRSRGVADSMSKGVQFLMKKNKIDVIMGNGKVKPGKKVEVTAADGAVTVYDAKNIMIATGARARALPNIPIDGVKVIDYRKAMSLESQPKSLVVIGSGAIGVEFAYVYAAMGTKVTIVEFMPNIVPVEDEDVSKELAKQYKKLGIDIHTNSSVESVDTAGEGCKVSVKTPSGNITIDCDIVLSAAGVISNLENVGLEDVGIITDKGKILVNQWYETNIPGYYAIGDVTPGPALAHVASAEGIICVEKIANHPVHPLDYSNIPGCTYCSPEIASVGLTEKKAKEAGYEIKVGKFPFVASGKATAAGARDGFVKVIFDAKYGEFLGAHMIGYNVTEMIAEVVVARRLETTAHEIMTAVHPHPTISEAIKGATEAAYGCAVDL